MNLTQLKKNVLIASHLIANKQENKKPPSRFYMRTLYEASLWEFPWWIFYVF